MHFLITFKHAAEVEPVQNACCVATRVAANIPGIIQETEFTVWRSYADMVGGAAPIGSFGQQIEIPDPQRTPLLEAIQGVVGAAYATGIIAPLVGAELVP